MTHLELKEMIKVAMKAREEVKLSVLRGLLTAATNELISKNQTPDSILPEEDLMALVRRAAKQRKDSITQFEKGGRADLSAKEKNELAILESFLPAMMRKDEVEKIAKAKAVALGIADASKKNQLIGSLMKELKGRADGTTVKEVVDNLF